MNKKISVLIPVYNEKDTIREVLKRVFDTPCFGENKEIIVIDDGSYDGTLDILNNLKNVAHRKNYGKGSAIRDGIKRAEGDIIVIQDADFEYNPNDYEKILEILNDENPVVYGSRNLARKRRGYFLYFFGAKILTGFFNMLFSTNLTDVYTCYKAFKSYAVKDINIQSNGFEFEAEITAKISKKKILIKEVPINYYPRRFNNGKKIRAKDGLRGMWAILKYRFKKI